MQKKVMVISLGGSQIFHDEKVNVKFLLNFKKILRKHQNKYKFIVVCGGGFVARVYIHGLEKAGINEKLQSFVGISVTRTNARLVSYFFGNESEDGIPSTMKDVERYLSKQEVVVCGALEYKPDQTSDSTSAQIAKHFNCEFINLTNVDGLYDSNPLTNKNAKFIPESTWKGLYDRAMKIPFSPGMHFVIDQKASKIIMDEKIKTYIIGPKIKNLDKLLSGKKFKGTLVFG